MIEEVGRLGRETFVILRICRHHHLDRLLAELLGDSPYPVSQELGRVGAFRPLGCSSSDGRGQPAEQVTSWVLGGGTCGRVSADHRGEAGPGSSVARRPFLFRTI